MDYFQGIVADYLQADRSVFVNDEVLIQLEPGNSPLKDRHWYCDILAVNLKESKAYLCEVSYAKSMQALTKRLKAWCLHWDSIRACLQRDSNIPLTWDVIPWVFIPEGARSQYDKKVGASQDPNILEGTMPAPRITYLESVVPWKYQTWDRKEVSVED